MHRQLDARVVGVETRPAGAAGGWWSGSGWPRGPAAPLGARAAPGRPSAPASQSARTCRAQGRKTSPAPVSVTSERSRWKSGRAELVLEGRHGTAHRRLGHVQPGRGPGETPLLGHAHHVAELLQLHIHSLRLWLREEIVSLPVAPRGLRCQRFIYRENSSRRHMAAPVAPAATAPERQDGRAAIAATHPAPGPVVGLPDHLLHHPLRFRHLRDIRGDHQPALLLQALHLSLLLALPGRTSAVRRPTGNVGVPHI